MQPILGSTGTKLSVEPYQQLRSSRVGFSVGTSWGMWPLSPMDLKKNDPPGDISCTIVTRG